MTKRRLEQFAQGMGVEPTRYVCAECGYSSENRKNFRRHEEGHTCSTGHYMGKDGELRRQKNVYAKGQR